MYRQKFACSGVVQKQSANCCILQISI